MRKTLTAALSGVAVGSLLAWATSAVQPELSSPALAAIVVIVTIVFLVIRFAGAWSTLESCTSLILDLLPWW